MKYIFSDFDGTLTDGNQLSPIFFEIINLLKNHQAPFIIVTGRSKSWAHFLLTHFQYLDSVISEGGGTLSTRNDIDFEDISLVSKENLTKLEMITSKLLENFKKLSLTSDSFGRESDRAIDLKLLEQLQIKNEVEQFLSDHEIHFSCSSVHLNFWCGKVSKALAVAGFIERKGISKTDCIYFGDAKNDQSMFYYFDETIGVSNIKSVLNELTYRPKIILEGNENRGPFGVYNYLKEKTFGTHSK